jgi:ABC-type transport system involved in multi-copper enzyme maturation permease subunit
MVKHLVWHDVKQNLRPVKVLLFLALAMYLAYKEVEGPSTPESSESSNVQGALTLHNWWTFTLIPLAAGLMGASLAAERRGGVTLTILSRGVTRGQYVVSKLLGAAVSSALIIALMIAGFYVLVVSMWPLGRCTHIGNEWNPGPYQVLYLQNPLAHDMLVASMLITASAALSLIGVLAGLVVANEYVAMAAPPIFTILFTILMRRVTDALNPENYIGLRYDVYVPPSLVLYAPYYYWTTFSLIITMICQRIFARKEIA